MVLDYSKWDSIELSDDSDIEVHPNVDKRSFIRAKQSQIHQQRLQRRHEIETLKFERIINDGLLSHINKLLATLRLHDDSTRNPEELVFQNIMDFASNPTEDKPPTPPEGIYTHEKEQPKYSQMMSSLVDQVKKEFGEPKPDNLWHAYIQGVQEHKDKVEELQRELLGKLAELEKEESSKITTDMLQTGFDTSLVNRSSGKGKAPASEKTESVELLNSQSASKESNKSSPEDLDDEDINASDLAKQFAKIPVGDYRRSHQFISEHPEIVADKECDGLLAEAFSTQVEGKEQYARQCVHQGLLLRYCALLGKDGTAVFFKRITTPEHQARAAFSNDVNETYNRIKTRVAEIAKENANNEAAGVEQIQLHAVDPNTTIHITIPPAESSDPAAIEARKIFDSFSPDLRKALESESLDEVNKVLGKMSVPEAEDILEKFSEGSILSIQEGVVDTTTEEGKKQLEQLEAEGKQEKEIETVEEVGEPGEGVTELD